jgi:two-component system, sporulation sensor kinase E
MDLPEKNQAPEQTNNKETAGFAERLAFTGRIAASIAHEIRNPLTNVSMSAMQLKEAFAHDSPWTRHIEIIMRNTERINFLITELLNCARPPELNMQPHDINGILEGTLDSIRSKITAQRIRVRNAYCCGSSIVSVDREQITRVFSNVMINALDAMLEGGTLTIETGIEASSFIVKIKDTGTGIPEEDIIRIFDPFFSTKSSGIGLGLSMTYTTVVSHGGTINVESRRKKSTVFTISLPMQ